MSDKPQKQAREKADQLTCGSSVVTIIVSLLIELSIGDEKCSLPLCAYVTGFGKSGHISGKIHKMLLLNQL